MVDQEGDCVQPESSRSYKIEESETDEGTLIRVIIDNVVAASVMVKEKSKGIKSYQSAPHFSLSECAWTFSGSFTIIFLLCFISANITLWNEHGGYAFPLGKFEELIGVDSMSTFWHPLSPSPPQISQMLHYNTFTVFLGPFGALTTLHYSLGDCPPAQPRNVILGSTLSGSIALLTTYIPETIISSTVRIAFATSFSIASMAALGIPHPPGGAISLVFALGHHHWGHLLLTICGCWIAVFLATVTNNLNDKRQYPQYWDFTSPFKKTS